ncbi:methyltransferase-like 26 [Sycon ciliatum]|uniref:methyltransferase-like 26 n=1 Tax=Sycon ciliatum TaxID=27933 RepID=UPI0031F6EDA2
MTAPVLLLHHASKPLRHAVIRISPGNADVSHRWSSSVPSVRTRMFFPAAERNKKAIVDVLDGHLDRNGRFAALETASGSGQHIAAFAEHFPNAEWQPSEVEERCIDSIRKNVAKLPNVRAPILLDCTSPVSMWNTPHRNYDVIVCSNMIHIAPFNVCEGFVRGSGQLLKPGGLLFIYGPFAFDGVLEPDSNIQFHRTLVNSNPEWGVRDVADIKALGKEVGLTFVKAVPMPANNHTVIFSKDKPSEKQSS